MAFACFIVEAFFAGEHVETELYANIAATLGASVVVFIGEAFHIGDCHPNVIHECSGDKFHKASSCGDVATGPKAWFGACL